MGGILPLTPLWVASKVCLLQNSTQNLAMDPLEFGQIISAEKQAESDRRSFFCFVLFWSSPKSWQKNGLNLNEDLFFWSSSSLTSL